MIVSEINMPEISAVELYSGIGGLHCGVSKFNQNLTNQTKIKITHSFDINQNCNKVYSRNFPETKVTARPLDIIKPAEFDNLQADLILMSPPCQPYTRQGNKKDHEDERAQSFLHLLENVWPEMKSRPKMMILENVSGFETSVTHGKLIKFLKEHNYVYKEFMLSPIHLGIPYQRLRYFLVAVHEPENGLDCEDFPILSNNQVSNGVREECPLGSKVRLKKFFTCGKLTIKHVFRHVLDNNVTSCKNTYENSSRFRTTISYRRSSFRR